MKRNISVCIIKNNENEFLLQKKTLDYKWFPGGWTFFGGSIENNESAYDAIIRELIEEIGIKTNPKFLFECENEVKGIPQKINVFVETINDVSKIKLGEGAGFAFFSKEELSGLKINSDMVDILNKYLGFALEDKWANY